MPTSGHQPVAIPAGQATALVTAALEKAGTVRGSVHAPLSQAPSSLVSHWPAWVGRAGVVAGPGVYALWCEPQTNPRETFPSQLILNLPAGRYMIDVLDVGRAAWISRESAAGGPLVIGLPYTAGTVMAWVRLPEPPAAPAATT